MKHATRDSIESPGNRQDRESPSGAEPLRGEIPLATRRPSAWSALALACAYLLMIMLSIAMFRTGGTMPAGSELSLPRSVFTVCNAASLTGFGQTITVDSYKLPGKIVIFALIVAGSLLSMIAGTAAVARLIGLPWSLGRIVLAGIVVEASALVVGGAVLIGTTRDLFAALFQAASAFGNCGVVIGPTPGMHDSLAHVLILPLAVIGGLGLPVLIELFDLVRAGRRISFYSRAVLALAAGVYVLALIPLLHQQWPAKVPEGSTLARELREPLINSSTTAINSRTLGWPMQSPATWPRAMQWVVILLMLIGAAPASTGGGLKTTCLLELCRGSRRALAGSATGRVFGIAMMWVGLYLLLILITTMRLTASEPQLPSDQILFIATSAVGNVGLSPAPISITGDGLYTLSITMVLGRVLPLAILWWAALTTRDAELAVA